MTTDEEFNREEVIARLKERRRRFVEDVITNQCWTTEEFMERTGHDENHIFYVADKQANYFYLEHEGSRYWPKFQLEEGTSTTPDNFDLVQALLLQRGHDQWMIYQFWISASPRWENAVPNIDMLRNERLDMVLWDARTYLEHGGT